MGGNSVPSTSGYPQLIITGSSTITHKVQTSLQHLTVQNEVASVIDKKDLSLTLLPKAGYQLPASITVTMSGNSLGTDQYNYNPGNGYIHIYSVTGDIVITATGVFEIKNVNGDLNIKATGVMKEYFEVVLALTNLISDPAFFEPLVKDSEVKFTLKAAFGYTLPTSITVTMGNNTLTSADYSYDSTTGVFTLKKITDILVITAAGNKIPDPEPEPDPTLTIYIVTLPVVEGAILEAGTSTSVEAGKSFEFTLTLQAGYNASQLTVKANGSILTPVSNGHYVIEKVMSNIVVTITGIVKNDPTSNTEVDPDKLKVWNGNGRLHIRTSISGTAYIVTLDGRLYKTLSLPAGETVTNVPQGLYIIHIGKRSYKIQL